MKKFICVLGNIFGVILAFVLSIALLVMLVITPMVSGAAEFTQPATIRRVVQQMDYEAIIQDALQNSEVSGDERKALEFFLDLTKSHVFGDLIELYAEDLVSAFDETPRKTVLTREALERLVRENMEELITLTRNLAVRMEEDLSDKTDTQLEAEIWDVFYENVDRFLEKVPTAEDLQNLMQELSDALTGKSTGTSFNESSGGGAVMLPSDEDDEYVDDSYSYMMPSTGGEITVVGGDTNGMTTVNVSGTVDPETGMIKFTGPDGETFYIDPDDLSGEDGYITVIGGLYTEPSAAVPFGGGKIFAKARPLGNRALNMSLAGTPNPDQDKNDSGVNVVLKAAGYAKSGVLTVALCIVIAVFAVLIGLLRWPRFKGLMWVAVIMLLGAGACGAMIPALGLLPGLLEGKAEAAAMVAESVIQVLQDKLLVAAIVYGVIAVVLVVAFILLRVFLRRSKARKAAQAVAPVVPAVEAPAEETAPEEAPAVEEVSGVEEVPVEEAPAEEEAVTEEELPAEEAEELPEEAEETPTEEAEEIPAEETEEIPEEEAEEVPEEENTSAE